MKNAILSVFNKKNLNQLAEGLKKFNIQILSSGGTANELNKLNIPVTTVSDYTGMPEILNGRLKTIHPKICGGILARSSEEDQSQLLDNNIENIDLVVVNLYPFKETVLKGAKHNETVEMIDIGGPTLIRAAAKNYERVTVVVDPEDYSLVLEDMENNNGETTENLRKMLAAKAFAHTADYDSAIANYFNTDNLPKQINLSLEKVQQLRYGENPHQKAALYLNTNSKMTPSIVKCQQLQGKELSYNNILDADAALNLVLDLPENSVCIIKHTNPCGAACGTDCVEAFNKAKATDPVSMFGGIIACNKLLTEKLAENLKNIFLEAIIAPEFEPEALNILSRKKSLRLLKYPQTLRNAKEIQFKSVSGGLLAQEYDSSIEDLKKARVVSNRLPTEEEYKALDFAWRICKHVKSNAIVFAKPNQLVSVGAGQMSRVDSVKLAVMKAQLEISGSVLASDAFFPFRDGIDSATKSGITAIVEPGGSIRDDEVIMAANENNIAMIFTEIRHFKH